MTNKIFQIHKRESVFFSKIEDKYAYDKNKKVFTIADGAGSSFRPDVWAGLITKTFVEEPYFDSKQLIQSFRECAKYFDKIDFEISTKPAIAAIEKKQRKRGASSTFIGISVEKGNKVQIVCSGDSNVFIINKAGEIKGFPHSNLQELKKDTHFLGTKQLLKNEIDETWFRQTSYNFHKGDTIILATDALSRYIFNYPEEIKKIISLSSFEQFLNYCEEKWDSLKLEEDDITACIIQDIKSNTIEEIIPPINFKFPKRSPAHPTSNHSSNSTDMKELLRKIEDIETNIQKLKNTIQPFYKLLKIIIGLCIIIVILLVFSIFRNPFSTHIKTNIADSTTVSNTNNENSREVNPILSKDSSKKQLWRLDSSSRMSYKDTSSKTISGDTTNPLTANTPKKDSLAEDTTSIDSDSLPKD